MPRRMDVELTSSRDDGTWTWRAAGARAPKGVVDATVLYEGAKVGDVLRAEVEVDVDGITILSVTPPKGKSGEPADRLEILGPPREFQGVTASLVPKGERPRRDRRDRDRDRPRRDGEGTDRRGERSGRPDGARPAGGERSGAGASAGRGGDRPERGGRPDRPDRPRNDRGERRPGGPRERREPAADAGRPRPKRLNPASTHRNAVLEALSPEQRPIAEQLLRGGIPAVRRAIEEQNAKARAEGMPEIKPEPLLAIAEDLLPRLKAAEWRDRAEAAQSDVDAIGLRDLRSVVSGSDANARDDETRKLSATLREALDRRLKEERDEWTRSITTALEEHRLVRALRVATRPPDPSMRLPSDLAMQLAAAASQGLSPESTPDRWSALLEAVVASPVRTTVKPVGLPAEPGEPLLQAARQAAGRIPALAQLLGMALPPPPTATRKPGGRRPVPPPPRPHAAANTEAAPAEPPEPAPAAAVAEPPQPAAPSEQPEPAAPSEQPE